MKNLKTIFFLSLLLTSMILTGCADSAQNSNPKSSEATTTSAVTATASAISTTSSAISASSSAMQPVDPLSVEGQLKTIAEAKDKIATRGKYDANHHYAVTDLDQNGRLELIIATEMNGTGHITHNWYYEISKDGSKLKKCKGKAFGKEGHDILDAINTVYIDQKEHNYYYRVYGITHVSGGENYESLGFLQLKNGTFTDNYLAGGSHIVSKKGNLKNSYYKLTKNGNKKTAKITKKQYLNIDSLMSEKYGELKKESVAIQWFSYQQPMSEVTESQFLHKLQKSQENFSIGKKVKKCKEYNWCDSLKNLKNIDWEEQQYNMCPEDYTMLAKYLPMLKNEQKIHFPDGTEQTLEEYLTGKEDIYRQVQLVDLTGDGIKELILSLFLQEDVIFSYQNGEYAAFLSIEAAFELKPGGYFSYDETDANDNICASIISRLQYKDGKLKEFIVGKTEDFLLGTGYWINNESVSQEAYEEWEDKEIDLDGQQYSVYEYVLEEKEE